MAKRIETIDSEYFGEIEVGSTYIFAIPNPLKDKRVERIEFSEEYGTHFVYFKDTTKTLEVFDINYVIRDEE